jgi:hypothetical protein
MQDGRRKFAKQDTRDFLTQPMPAQVRSSRKITLAQVSAPEKEKMTMPLKR